MAASEKRPLPQPTSRKLLWASPGDPSISLSERSASATRSGVTSSTKFHQFLPNSNLGSVLVSVIHRTLAGSGLNDRIGPRGGGHNQAGLAWRRDYSGGTVVVGDGAGCRPGGS